MYYYCNCSTDKKKKKAVNAGRTPFREVSVVDEVCQDCEHYAVAYFKRIDPDGGNLYSKIMTEIEEFKPENEKGGSSLKTQKNLLKRKRGMSESSGENKDGNMDF